MSWYHFDNYMMAVDKLLIEKTGLTSDDLPDFCWRLYHEEQTSPLDAVEFFLEDTDLCEYIDDSIEALYGEY